MHVLIIEDDRDAAGYMAKGLKESGHNVEVVHSGREGLLLAAGADYDVLIVDRMLPELDGLSLVKTLRATGNQTPVLFVSALGEVDERVKGLRSGGDDYLAKPYAFSELLARLESLAPAARRGAQPPAPRPCCATTTCRSTCWRAGSTRGGKPIDLQPREFKLLEVLMRHAGQVMTRTMLLEKVWDYRFDPQTNVIDVHISRLRQKVDRGYAHPLIQTVRGAGYSLRAPDKAA